MQGNITYPIDRVLNKARGMLTKSQSPASDPFERLVDELADPRSRSRFSRLRHQLGLDRVVSGEDVGRMVKALCSRGNGFAKVQSQLDKMLRQAQPAIIQGRLDDIRTRARREFAQGGSAYATKLVLEQADALEREMRRKGVIR